MTMAKRRNLVSVFVVNAKRLIDWIFAEGW